MLAAKGKVFRLHRIPSLNLTWEQVFPSEVVAISLSSALAVAATADGEIYLLNIATGQPRARFGEPGQLFCALAISPDGACVYGATVAGKVFRWNSANGSLLWQKETKLVYPGSLQEHPMRETISLISRHGGEMTVVEALDGNVLETHENCLATAPHGDGYLLVRDRHPMLVQFTTEHQVDTALPEFLASPKILAASDDGKNIALVDDIRGLWLWNTKSRELVANYLSDYPLKTGMPKCTTLLFSRDSLNLAAAFDNGEVAVFDLRSERANNTE
jgi:WD40 repeat protein